MRLSEIKCSDEDESSTDKSLRRQIRVGPVAGRGEKKRWRDEDKKAE